MSACQVCHNLTKDENSRRRLYLEFTPSSLQQSALVKECQPCFILLKGISLMQDATWSFNVDVSNVYGYGLATETDTLILEVYFINDRPRLMLEFFCAGDNNSGPLPWKAIRPKTSPNGHPLSKQALDWVRSKIDTCSGSHLSCPTIMERQFPNRILSLQKTSDANISVKLIQIDDHECKSGIYATLSHCWGSKLQCKLTTKNLQKRLCGIPWWELPQTFHDAIEYCLELQISYLWIDALCIMQDNPKDWQVESGNMANIYQNSYITLAATSADSGLKGCFATESKTSGERSLEVTTTAGRVGKILIRHLIPHWTTPPTAISKENHPLLSRGWVFQERLLSPRVLHFCNQELVWECGQEAICECGSLPTTRNLKLQFSMAASNGEFIDSFVNRQEAIDQWHGIVEQYSALDLTEEKDCLPALSGLAQRMSRAFLGEYFAGLWERSLTRDLRWRLDRPVRGRREEASYRGPSWSWVSTNAKVVFLREDHGIPRTSNANRLANSHARSVDEMFGTDRQRHLASARHSSITRAVREQRARTLETISCIVKTEGKNKYGEVSSAFLIVEGNLKAAKIREDRMATRDPHELPSWEVEVWHGKDKGREAEVARDIENIVKSEPGAPSWRFPFFADYNLKSAAQYRIRHWDTVFLLSVSETICLVLFKTPMEYKDNLIFRRIGILQLPTALQATYGIHVMKGSQRTRLAII